MRVVRRSSQGDHPSPGRGQAIAPTMDGPGKALRGHSRGAPLWSPCRCAASSLLICYTFSKPFHQGLAGQALLDTHCRGKTCLSTRLDR
jgi:hypothetical protein